MWALLGILIAFMLFLTALYFSYTLAAPVAAVVAGAIAVWLVLAEFAAATAAVFRGAGPTEHLGIEPPPPDSTDDKRDPAYRSYYFGPVFRDYSLAVEVAAQRAWQRTFAGRPVANSSGESQPNERTALAQRIFDFWSSLGNRIKFDADTVVIAKILISGPMVGGLVGVGLGATAAAIFAGLVSAVFGLFLGIIQFVTIGFAGVLRALEVTALQIRGITLECSSCHRRVGSPAYRCPRCPALHRRLIPGSLGVFWHICRCGNALPTTLAKGKWNLPAYCQHEGCNKPLPRKGMTTPTFHVPVVAGRAAGKTVFMMAAVAGLKKLEESEPPAFEFADPEAEKEYVKAHAALQKAAFSGIRATVPVKSVQAFNVYVGPEGAARRRLLYLYDAAGERYESSDGVTTFRFLDHTAGVVLIIDPFSFERVRRNTPPDVLATLRHSEADADEVFSRFVQSLRENLSSRTDRKMSVPVAVVLTKCDALLTSPDLTHPYDELSDAAGDPTRRSTRSDAVQNWLKSVAGERGLVTSLENTFERCGYFAVSALDAFTVKPRPSGRTRTVVRNDDTAAPILWLLPKREGK